MGSDHPCKQFSFTLIKPNAEESTCKTYAGWHMATLRLSLNPRLSERSLLRVGLKKSMMKLIKRISILECSLVCRILSALKGNWQNACKNLTVGA